MQSKIYYWFRSAQRKLSMLRSLPGKLPGNVFVEAASFGYDFGEMAAQHQSEIGFLGQFGSYGGSPFTPEGIDREMFYLRIARIF